MILSVFFIQLFTSFLVTYLLYLTKKIQLFLFVCFGFRSKCFVQAIFCVILPVKLNTGKCL
ncbi:hypothetical protein KSS87_021443 [Heliosperma pusillum]|nr:hypothetical protein KSS87_021443 [Heliosperma pusillum]